MHGDVYKIKNHDASDIDRSHNFILPCSFFMENRWCDINTLTNIKKYLLFRVNIYHFRSRPQPADIFVRGQNNSNLLFFLLLMLLFRSVCHQVSNQADKLDLLAIFYY